VNEAVPARILMSEDVDFEIYYATLVKEAI
jgi:hypothetical protein